VTGFDTDAGIVLRDRPHLAGTQHPGVCERGEPLFERHAQFARQHHATEGFAPEFRSLQAYAAEVAAAADVDAAQRAGRRCQQRQYAQRLQRADAGGRQGQAAFIEGRSRASCPPRHSCILHIARRHRRGRPGLDQGRAPPFSLQRAGQAGANKATPQPR